MSRLYHSLEWCTRNCVTSVCRERLYGITYLFHDRRARANSRAYEQRDQLVTLGHASMGVGYGTLSHSNTVLRDRRQK